MVARSCPVCQSRSVRSDSLVAALFQSDARCSACNSSVQIGQFSHSVIWTVAILSILSTFWLGLAVGIAGTALTVAVGLFTARLKAEESDPIAQGHDLRKKMARSRAEGDA